MAMKALRCLVIVMLACLAAAPAPAEDMKARKRAARELLDATDMRSVLDRSIDTSLAMQLQRRPELEPYQAQIKAFFEKYMGYEAMRSELVDLYAETFSQTELEDLTAFYRTPTGQKALKALPRLLARATELATTRVEAHQSELHDMIRKRARELSKGAAE